MKVNRNSDPLPNPYKAWFKFVPSYRSLKEKEFHQCANDIHTYEVQRRGINFIPEVKSESFIQFVFNKLLCVFSLFKYSDPNLACYDRSENFTQYMRNPFTPTIINHELKHFMDFYELSELMIKNPQRILQETVTSCLGALYDFVDKETKLDPKQVIGIAREISKQFKIQVYEDGIKVSIPSNEEISNFIIEKYPYLNQDVKKHISKEINDFAALVRMMPDFFSAPALIKELITDPEFMSSKMYKAKEDKVARFYSEITDEFFTKSIYGPNNYIVSREEISARMAAYANAMKISREANPIIRELLLNRPVKAKSLFEQPNSFIKRMIKQQGGKGFLINYTLVRFQKGLLDLRRLREKFAGKELETVLVYGHYDVQPAKKEDGWTGEPFSLIEKKGKFIARGIVDNKGQNLIHIFTVIDLIKQKNLGYNVKFLIEGNEETANPDMAGLVKKYKNLLKSDHIIISDGEIVRDNPTIEASLRGGFNMTATLRTAKNNLHSGLCGGAVPSASHEMAILINKLFSKTNKIAIPGFYNGVDKVTKAQLDNNKIISTDEELAKLLGVKKIITGESCDFHTQTGLFPTIQISGVKTGYIEEGYCNIVPCEAEIRMNVRLVASQKPQEIFDSIKKFIIKNIPDYVELKIERDGLSDPIKINIDSEIAKKAKKILKDVYKKEPIIKYVGGGIPVVADFKNVLGIDSALISLGNDDCNMHGVNENFTIDLVSKGLEFSRIFFSK